jgi:hypothetical protein
MTQYLLSVHMVEGSVPRTPAEQQQAYHDTALLNDELQASETWVFGGGLAPVSSSTVVTKTDGTLLITDGPFAEGKEHIGGFWIIEAPDLDAALEIAARASVACREPVEVRPFQEAPPL